MQSLHHRHPLLLPFPTSPYHKVYSFTLLHLSPPPRRRPLTTTAAGAGAGGFSSDEVPVDESFLEKFGPKEKESEDEARRRNWVERGWAPWEEVLSPEGYFARMSLNEGEEVPLQSPEAIEAFRLLSPEYRRKKMEESGMGEEEWYAHQFSTKAEVPDPIQTSWNGPLAFRIMPPRDWPPRGWEVDGKELAFIREAHRMQAERVESKDVGGLVRETGDLCLERYEVFLKQYKEWVVANRDQLEEESYKVGRF